MRDGWAGRTACVVASGPSLTPADCDEVTRRQRAAGWRCIAVKDNFRLLPQADVIYGCDPHFWRAQRDGLKYIDEMRAHGAELWTQDVDAARTFGLHWIRGEGTQGLGRKSIHWGGNSGFQAMNLAYLFGAKRLVLLGFDMQRGEDDRCHWFGDHPAGQGFANPRKFNHWIRAMDVLARDLADQGVQVINATRRTALKCFPQSPIEQIPV